MPINAQSNLNKNSVNEGDLEINFIPPQDSEKPETEGAGTRDPNSLKCAPNDSEMMAIMPQDNFGLTTQERPEIFIYLPQTSAKQAVLSVRDREDNYYEVAFLPIDKTSDIVSFALPEDKPPLASDRYYQWKLTFVCGDRLNVDDPILSGWLKRKEPQLDSDLFSQLSLAEQARWYGENGYWYDLLQQVKRAESMNYSDECIAKVWQNLRENN